LPPPPPPPCFMHASPPAPPPPARNPPHPTPPGPARPAVLHQHGSSAALRPEVCQVSIRRLRDRRPGHRRRWRVGAHDWIPAGLAQACAGGQAGLGAAAAAVAAAAWRRRRGAGAGAGLAAEAARMRHAKNDRGSSSSSSGGCAGVARARELQLQLQQQQQGVGRSPTWQLQVTCRGQAAAGRGIRDEGMAGAAHQAAAGMGVRRGSKVAARCKKVQACRDPALHTLGPRIEVSTPRQGLGGWEHGGKTRGGTLSQCQGLRGRRGGGVTQGRGMHVCCFPGKIFHSFLSPRDPNTRPSKRVTTNVVFVTPPPPPQCQRPTGRGGCQETHAPIVPHAQ
jgi:hypothetical protein